VGNDSYYSVLLFLKVTNKKLLVTVVQ